MFIVATKFPSPVINKSGSISVRGIQGIRFSWVWNTTSFCVYLDPVWDFNPHWNFRKLKFNFIWDNIKARGSLTKWITLHGSGFVLAHIDSNDAMLWLGTLCNEILTTLKEYWNLQTSSIVVPISGTQFFLAVKAWCASPWWYKGKEESALLEERWKELKWSR